MRNLVILCWFLVLFWGGGLVLFSHSLPVVVVNKSTKTDAIVVLTGGSYRVAEGVNLLKRGIAKKLFISGVYEDVMLPELVNLTDARGEDLSCCVDLGYRARNTTQNAEEVAEWMRQNNFTSMRLVTSNYHLPRARLEVKNKMPGVQIISHPVFTEVAPMNNWWRDKRSFGLLVSEYNKFVFTYVRQWL